MIAISLVTLLALAAGDDVASRARQDVEAQLQKVAPTPAPQLTLLFSPAAGRGYALEQAAFTLDGKPLPTPSVESLKTAAGAVKLFGGVVREGEHELTVKLVYAGDFGFLSYMTGYKFRLNQQVTFETRRGLDVALTVAPKLDPEKEWQQRLGIGVTRSETMLAQVDATEPEPLARPPRLVEPPPPPETETVPIQIAAAEELKPQVPRPANSRPRTPPPPRLPARPTAPAPAPEPAPEPTVAVAAPAPEPQPAPVVAEPAPKLQHTTEALSPVPEPSGRDARSLWIALGLLALALASFVGIWVSGRGRPAPRA